MTRRRDPRKQDVPVDIVVLLMISCKTLYFTKVFSVRDNELEIFMIVEAG